ncbi:MAG: hypothetical protein JRI38_07165 [Deltaproteobacteria bacterium]|nr:hypothetical protein [Deltaproteobacteria bacterium]
MTPADTRNTGISPSEMLQRHRARLLEMSMSGDSLKFLSANARLLDDYFRRSFEISRAGPAMDLVKNPYAIIALGGYGVALGGYGRKEQCLASDVDLLFLFHKKIPASANNLIREIIYPLWDMGIEVGYATRPWPPKILTCLHPCLMPVLSAVFRICIPTLWTRWERR